MWEGSKWSTVNTWKQGEERDREENSGYGGKGGRGRNPETWGKESRGGMVELFDLKGVHSSSST